METAFQEQKTQDTVGGDSSSRTEDGRTRKQKQKKRTNNDPNLIPDTSGKKR